MGKADEAVRNYLLAVREPEALVDEDAARQVTEQLRTTDDPVERLRLRQRLLDSRVVDPGRYEPAFVAHARAWADSKGISQAAFRAEGVSDAVLRRAGFSLPRNGGRAAPRTGRARVSAEAVRRAIPKGDFTIRDVQEASGASAAVVRRVVQQEVEAGRVREVGTEPQPGPGRSPALYRSS